MHQPALRLALLTFATILVSGCAEQFATHLVQTNWGTPVQMPHRRSQQAASDSASEQTAGSFWSERQKRKLTGAWQFARVLPFCLSKVLVVIPECEESPVPAWSYALLRNRAGDGRAMRTSDYCRERVG